MTRRKEVLREVRFPHGVSIAIILFSIFTEEEDYVEELKYSRLGIEEICNPHVMFLCFCFTFQKYKTFSVFTYSYINTSGNWKNEKLCGNTTPAGRSVFTKF